MSHKDQKYKTYRKSGDYIDGFTITRDLKLEDWFTSQMSISVVYLLHHLLRSAKEDPRSPLRNSLHWVRIWFWVIDNIPVFSSCIAVDSTRSATLTGSLWKSANDCQVDSVNNCHRSKTIKQNRPNKVYSNFRIRSICSLDMF